MHQNASIYIAGHLGLAGSAIWKHLESLGFKNLIGHSSREVDLTDRVATFAALREAKPSVVIDAAALVGGIKANSSLPVDFLHTNLKIQLNLMEAAFDVGAEGFLFLGSSCIYPKLAPQPIAETQLFQGSLEPTNIGYAMAKISGVVQIQSYRQQHGLKWISAMPTNLYGPGDNFDPDSSHVLAALIRRFHEAKFEDAASVAVWGTGSALREFMHSEDLASAVVFLLQNYDEDEPINVGSGDEISIKDLAVLVAETVGFRGDILFDHSKPDGTPRKLLDSSKIRKLGWSPTWDLRSGVVDAYNWFITNPDRHRVKDSPER